jgi:hypothetical protein
LRRLCSDVSPTKVSSAAWRKSIDVCLARR